MKKGSSNDVKAFGQQGALAWQQKAASLCSVMIYAGFEFKMGKKRKNQSLSNSFLSSLCSASFLTRLS